MTQIKTRMSKRVFKYITVNKPDVIADFNFSSVVFFDIRLPIIPFQQMYTDECYDKKLVLNLIDFSHLL